MDTLLYDGHCRLCAGTARSMKRWAGPTLTLTSFRDDGVLERFGLSTSACEAAIHLVRPDGRVDTGVGAFVGALRHRWFGVPLRLLEVPGLRWVADRVYAFISKWRFRIAGTTCTDGCSIYR